MGRNSLLNFAPLSVVDRTLVKTFDIKPTTTADEDLRAILG